MERKEFLRSLGGAAAFALVFPCLHGCSKDEINGNLEEVPTGVDFIIDLNSAEAAKLAVNGGFILKNLVVVARNLQGEYVAASQVCSHESYDGVRFLAQDGGIFRCDVHGSRFAQDGSPLNSVEGDAPKPLKIFNTELDGSMLRVYE